MDLKELHYFRVIAELGNITKAAALLRVAQPALSRYVRSLEHDLGADLLKRTSRGVMLTPAGEVLLKRTAHLENELNDVRREVARFSIGLVGHLKIACMHPLSSQLMPNVLVRYRAEHPNIALSLDERYSGDIVEDLLSRRLDLAIVDAPNHSHADLTIFSVWKEAVHLFGPAAGRSARLAETVNMKDILDLPIIMPSNISALRGTVDRAFVRAGGHFAPVIEANGPAMIFSMVAAGLGFGLMPLCSFYDHVVDGTLASVPTDPQIWRKISIVTRTELLEERPVSALFDLLRECALDLAETDRFASVTPLFTRASLTPPDLLNAQHHVAT